MRAAAGPRDVPVLMAGVAGVTAVAWLNLWHRAGAMTGMAGAGGAMNMRMSMAMTAPAPWSLSELFAAGAMWSVMMIAMMLPAAAPVLALFAAARRGRAGARRSGVPDAAMFAAGFVLLWMAWSWLAAAAQWTLQARVALSPQLTVARMPAAAAILAVAGLYQFTPLKDACLSRCRSPLGFLLSEWRDGAWGSLRMGVRYGALCAGCCWALMGLLFVVGVMNLLWIALLSLFVLVEKTALRGPWPGRIAGAALIVWAVYLLRGPAL